MDPKTKYGFDAFGRVPNWSGARRIRYQGADIRVFPHEFSIVEKENLMLYIKDSHVLVPDGVASDVIVQDVIDGDNRPLYEFALLEGADHHQAIAVAMGIDVSLPDPDVPPLGWYRCKPEYAAVFCDAREMEETH